jgi:hypothetical protein
MRNRSRRFSLVHLEPMCWWCGASEARDLRFVSDPRDEGTPEGIFLCAECHRAWAETAITALTHSSFTRKKLQVFAEILRTSIDAQQTPDELRRRIEEELPGSDSVLRLIKPRTPSEFWSMIAVLVAIISLLLQQSNRPPDVPTLVDEYLKRTPSAQASPPAQVDASDQLHIPAPDLRKVVWAPKPKKGSQEPQPPEERQ